MASRLFSALGAGVLALAVAPATVAFTAPAYAGEPTATEKDTARGLMADGRQKRDKGDLKGALKSFEAADAIMHVPSTAWEVATTQEKLGMLVEARDAALRVLRIPEGAREPQAFLDARASSQALVESLDARIPVVKVSVKNAPDGATLTVSIDQITMPGAALAAPIRVNPGHHAITVKTETASGTEQIDVAEKEKKEVTVTLEAGAVPPPPPPDKPIDTPPPPPEQKHTMRTVMWIGFGVGGAGVIAGAVTGLLTLSAKSSALNGCRDNRCPPSTYGDLDTASTMSTISTVSFIVAGVGAGVGVAALLIGDKKPAAERSPTEPAPSEPAPAQGLRVTPWVGLGSAGVRGTF